MYIDELRYERLRIYTRKWFLSICLMKYGLFPVDRAVGIARNHPRYSRSILDVRVAADNNAGFSTSRSFIVANFSSAAEDKRIKAADVFLRLHSVTIFSNISANILRLENFIRICVRKIEKVRNNRAISKIILTNQVSRIQYQDLRELANA